MLFNLFTPLATILRASISKPESVSSKIATFGSNIAIWKISFLFFSPPEKPSFKDLDKNLRSISNNSDFSRINFNISLAGMSSKPFALRDSLMAVFIKLVTETPGISTGYWKERKTPLCALSSGDTSSKSSPLSSIDPWVTSKFSLPAITEANVLLPEPFGPMIACTSPALTSRLIPFKISLSSTLACKFLIFNIICYFKYSGAYGFFLILTFLILQNLLN